MSVVINGSAGVTTNSGAVYNGISSGTAVASTSGTSIDFTSIPSWVKRITVMFNGVSTNGTSAYQIQIGDSGGIENTGYSSSASRISTTVTTQNGTAGFVLFGGATAAAAVYQGYFTISLLGSNAWCMQGAIADVTNTQTQVSCGSKTLSDTLTQIRITTVNGTDTFDAGSINILYE
jgi:hypothetical protein